MNLDVLFMLLLIIATLVLFILEVFPIVVTAMALLGVLIVTGFVDADQAVMGFSNKAAVTIGALFVLSHSLMKTGVLEVTADWLARKVRGRHWLGFGVLLLAVGILSGFLNNTAVVAIFIPLFIKLSRGFRISPSKVLIPLSYASIFGGTLTLVGTSTNLLVSGIAEQYGESPLTMFEFSQLGILFLTTGLVYLLLFAPRFLPGRSDPDSLTQQYQMGNYLTEVQVMENSLLSGRSCREVGVNENYDITVLAILRDSKRYTENVGSTPLRPGDILIARGTLDNIMRFRAEQGVALLPDIKLSDEELAEEGQVVVESLIPPASSLIGRTLKELDFRRHYGGFVLAVRRLGSVLRTQIAHISLRASDTLLMLIPRERLREVRSSDDLIVISEVDLELKRGRFWWLVIAILPAIIVLAATGVVEIVAGALLGAILLLMVGAITPQEAFRSVDWSVLFLIAAFVPVGQAMVDTGTAEFIAGGVLSLSTLFSPEMAPFAAVSILYLVTSLMTQMVSNNATAIILVPVALSLSSVLELDSRPFLIAICFAASAEFMTPTGYQTNLMVFGPGNYRFLDYTRFGAPLNLLFWLMASYLIPVFWPFNPR